MITAIDADIEAKDSGDRAIESGDLLSKVIAL